MYKSKQCYGAEEHLDGVLMRWPCQPGSYPIKKKKKLFSSFSTHLPKSGASKSITRHFSSVQFSSVQFADRLETHIVRKDL